MWCKLRGHNFGGKELNTQRHVLHWALKLLCFTYSLGLIRAVYDIQSKNSVI